MGSGFRHIAVVLSPSVIRRVTLGALFVMLMSACANTVRMSELDFPLDTARVKIIVDQQQLEPQPSRGSAGATLMFGHLVGAAVMSHQDTQAELFIAPMRERLKEIDLGDLFLSRIVEADLLDQLSQNAQVEIFRTAPENNTAAFYDGRFVILPSVRMQLSKFQDKHLDEIHAQQWNGHVQMTGSADIGTDRANPRLCPEPIRGRPVNRSGDRTHQFESVGERKPVAQMVQNIVGGPGNSRYPCPASANRGQ